MSLIDDLRATGEQLLDQFVPNADEAPKILGALIHSVEAAGIAAATDLGAKAKAPDAAPAGESPAAGVPIASEPAQAETVEQIEARLAAAKAAQAAAAAATGQSHEVTVTSA